MFTLRICRHCYGPLSMNATKCPHCKKATMDPKGYKRVLIGMGALLGIAFLIVIACFVYYLRAVYLYG